MGSLALTARCMAAARARESERADRLFDDPLAAALAGEEGESCLGWLDLAAWPFAPGPGMYSVVRTRFFDDFLIPAVRYSGARQVVLLAAGMDARAFRLDWPPGVRLYELDLPEVLDLKEKALSRLGVSPGAESNCERRVIATDLGESDWTRDLGAAGYDANEPSVWLAEGFLLYMDNSQVNALFEGVRHLAAPGSRLGADLINRDLFLSPSAWPLVETFAWLGAPLRFGTNTPEALLAGHGWEAEATQPGESGASYGRWPQPPPREVPGFPRSFLLTARRAKEP